MKRIVPAARCLLSWGGLVALLGGGMGGAWGQFRVVEATGGGAVPGATVSWERAGEAGRWGQLAADGQGGFALPAEGTGRMRVTAVGFAPLEVRGDTVPDGLLRLTARPFDLEAAVVTGQLGRRTREEVVQPVLVIDRQSIERIGAVTLRDVLLTQSNVQLGQDAQIGTQVRMLGLSGQHVQVLVDGLPVLGRLDGNIDFDQLPLDAVERIEIVEGPMSVEYGSQAIAGTIHLITRRGARGGWVDEEPGVRASVRGVAESVGRYQGTGSFQVGAVGGGRLDGRVSRLYFGGFNPPDRAGRNLLWKPKEQYAASLGWGREWKGLYWTVSGEATRELLWNDGPVEYVSQTVPTSDSILQVYRVPFAQDAEFVTRREVARADVNGTLGDGWQLEGFAAYNRYRRDRRTWSRNLVDWSEVPAADPELNDTSIFRNLHSRATLTRTWDSQLVGSVGYDVVHESAESDRMGDAYRSVQNLAVFGSVEWQPRPVWRIRPGLRVLHNTAFGTPVIPSLHVKWAHGPHAVRASYARGFRAPELKELYFYFVDVNHNVQGSADLDAEVSNSYQLGYTLRKLTDRALWQPTVKLFYNEVERMIDLGLMNAETQFYQYVNLGRVTTAGASLGIERAGDALSWRVQGTGVQRAVTWQEGGDAPERNLTLQATAAVDWRLPHQTSVALQASYAHNETILQADGAGGWAQSQLSPLTLVGAFLTKQWFQNRLHLSAGVDNLLGATTRTISGERVTTGGIHMPTSGAQPAGMGRNLRFTLLYTLS